MDYNGKICMVAGGAGDIGREIVRSLIAKNVAKIIVLDLNKSRIDELCLHDNVIGFECDLTSPDAVKQVFNKVYEHVPHIDILINSCGKIHSAAFVDITSKADEKFLEKAASWNHVVSTNLSATYYVGQLVAKKMIDSRIKGVLINISSVCSGGNPGQSAYSAAKAGVNALTQVWAKELGVMGVRAVAISPGYIDTPSTHAALNEGAIDCITSSVPMKKLGQVQDIVSAIDFAVENNYVNGTVINVDGGLVI